MVSSGLKKWADANGWTVSNNVVYGEQNGYLFVIYEEPGQKVFAITIPEFSEWQRHAVEQFLGQHKKPLKISSVVRQANTMFFIFKEQFVPMPATRMDTFLAELTAFLKENRFPGKERCSACGAEKNLGLVQINDLVMPLCEACYQRIGAEQAEKGAETAALDKRYAAGAAGAAIGGAIASALWVVLAIITMRSYAALGFLFGYTALQGYRMAKARAGRYTVWIVSLATAWWLAASIMASSAIILSRSGETPSFARIMSMYSNPGTAPRAWSDLAFAAGFAAVGVWSAMRDLKRRMEATLPTIRKVE